MTGVLNERGDDPGRHRKERAAVLLPTGVVWAIGLLMLSLGACGPKNSATPKTPTAAPTPPPITVVVTPTSTLPPNVQLDAKVDPSIARTLTAAAPAIPTGVGESAAQRRQDLARATPVPTISDHP